MAKFSGLPGLPIGSAGVNPALMTMLTGMTENINLLTGAKADGSLAAITRSDMTGLTNVAPQRMRNISATGQGVNFNGYNFPLLEDYNKLAQDVQALANDVAALKQELQSVVTKLRGS